MRAILWILLWLFASVSPTGAQTNVVDVLRQFMQELDRQDRGELTQTPGSPATSTAPARTPPSQPSSAPVQPLLDTPPASYRLRPGDRLKVEVTDESTMSTESAAIDTEGKLTLPIAGPVAIGGHTVEEATRIVRDFLGADYLVNPRVKLMLLKKAELPVARPAGGQRRETTQEIWPGISGSSAAVAADPPGAARTATPQSPNACAFSIANQVRKPGRYEWDCSQKMNLLRAIGMAGGYTSQADLTRVVIRRQVGDRRREFFHDLTALIANQGAIPPEIQPGDEVELPRK